MQTVNQLSDYAGAEWNNRLLNAIVDIQSAFIEESDIRRSFTRMLEILLELTDSEYGFLGEVLYSDSNQPYLKTHALTDISWDEATKKTYDTNMAKGFEFHNLNTLFGVTLATAETVVSNDPASDPRSGGLPHGHPGMRNYLGIPIKHNLEMLGMLGIANREGGYNESVVDSLSPLLITAGSMIQSMRSSNANLLIESELQEKHKLLNGVIHNIADSLIITDHTGIIQEVNKATETIFGHRTQELLGRNISMCMAGEEKKVYADTLKTFLLSGNKEVIQGRREIQGLNKKDSSFPVEITISDIKLGDKRLFVNILQDISDRKSQEIKIQEANIKLKALSETDELTGLYNRRFFDKVLHREFNSSRNTSRDLALAIIDVDHFKLYNDNYGHMNGDECLARIGKFLKDYFRRDCELPARIGGEEFAVVMSNMSKQECVDALNHLMQLLATENIPHEHSVMPHLTVSIGLATRTSATVDAAEMYALADQNLYKAKDLGRNRLFFVDEV